MSLLSQLDGASRLLLEAELAPAQGSRFQPTGFPDIGAAVYERPDGKKMILVESAQSMANRLERTCLAGEGPTVRAELTGLPYVLVNLTGSTNTQTSSLVEAHRLNSPFIITDPEFKDKLVKEMQYSKGSNLDWRRIARAIFKYDPSSLLHGVFFANLEDGRIKIPRAISGFIEAEDVSEAHSGGVKNNTFDPSGKIRVQEYDKDVYGNVPFHRTEYSAKKITAYFNLDLSLLRGFGLEPEAEGLLTSLALYKVRSFLDGGLRLRTACDLSLVSVNVREPKSFVLPDADSLVKYVQSQIRACAAKGLFPPEPVTSLSVKTVLKKGDEKGSEAESD
jgi:CRISPR-associated protein Csb1